MLSETRSIVADFINADDPSEIIFGANFTSLCFHASRALAQTRTPGDEVILSRLDHDANVSPWVLAARDAGVIVRYVDILEGSCFEDEFLEVIGSWLAGSYHSRPEELSKVGGFIQGFTHHYRELFDTKGALLENIEPIQSDQVNELVALAPEYYRGDL